MAWQRVRIDLPTGGGTLPPDTRNSIGQDIIEFIINRAQQENMGFNAETGRNKQFPSYSAAYAKRKGSTSVDLTLSADMFAALKVLSTDPRSILIGFENGSDENAKAEGNQRGTYGQKTPIPGKARPFLGISRSDLETILDKYDT